MPRPTAGAGGGLPTVPRAPWARSVALRLARRPAREEHKHSETPGHTRGAPRRGTGAETNSFRAGG